jgi:hypothetical protein
MTEAQTVVEDCTDQALSEIHHALRASRRRLVIALVSHRYFAAGQCAVGGRRRHRQGRKQELEVGVRQLAKEIAAIEQDTSLEEATGDDYRNVYTALVQTHLPELGDIEAIEYDDDRKTVRPGRNLAALAIVSTVSSPIAQMLFNDAVARGSRSELAADGSTSY